MRRAVPLLLVAGLLAGLAGGVGVSVALPDDAKPTRPAATAPPAPEPSPRATPPRVLDEPRRASQDLAYPALREVEDSVELEARTPDSRGGADWAVRVFEADRLDPGSGEVQKRVTCAQLGRVLDGTFGWIDAANSFRPVAFDLAGAPIRCDGDGGRLRFETLITDPAAGVAGPQQTVAWGYAPGGKEAEVRLGDRTERPAVSPEGAFIVPAGPDVRPEDVRIWITDKDGEREEQRFGAADLPPAATRREPVDPLTRRIPHPQWGRPATVHARAPDPAGGLSFGLAAAPGTEGTWCPASGRIVGDRVGRVDFALGTFQVAQRTPNCASAEYVSRLPGGEESFFTGQSGGGLDWELGGDPQPGRVERRTLEGTGVFSVQARSDVETITIVTSRDVRTLRPSGPSNSFLAVYDGSLPMGEITLTATFADGTTQTQVIPNPDL